MKQKSISFSTRLMRTLLYGTVFLLVALVTGLLFRMYVPSVTEESPVYLDNIIIPTEISPVSKDLILRWKKLDVERMKKQGCVADGLLSDYNKPKIDIPLAQESNCYYFHRALETWREPPDFERAREIITEIDREDALYGMFIAEAIDRKADYFYREEDRFFDFGEMCRKGSKNYWGEHTCKPSFRESEYQAYIKQITEDAMDAGIQVFLFGQIDHQEDNIQSPRVDNIIREMRAAAASRGIEILVGAQTVDVTSKEYLSFFDFIEGGIGIHPDGTIENGPCFSKYWAEKGDWCWPLMWHSRYKKRAQNIFVYLDWNGQKDDDMHVFASMDTELRHRVLSNLKKRMAKEDLGFFYPLITPLPRTENENCHGPDKDFYSPSMKYGCPDIDHINTLLGDRTDPLENVVNQSE